MTIVKAIIDDIVSACRTLGVKCDYDKSQVGEEGTFNNFVNNSVLFSIDQGQNSITLNINYVFYFLITHFH